MATETPTPQDSSPEPRRHGCRGGRRFGAALFVLAIAIVAGVAGGFVSRAFAQHGPFGARAFSDPARMDQHVERMVKHFAVEVDATPEQREKLTAIAKDAAKDLAPLRAKLADGRKQAVALVGASSVDRAAIERLRAEHLQLADQASKRVTQALADVADVLTPAQRQKIAEHMERRAARRGHG